MSEMQTNKLEAPQREQARPGATPESRERNCLAGLVALNSALASPHARSLSPGPDQPVPIFLIRWPLGTREPPKFNLKSFRGGATRGALPGYRHLSHIWAHVLCRKPQRSIITKSNVKVRFVRWLKSNPVVKKLNAMVKESSNPG